MATRKQVKGPMTALVTGELPAGNTRLERVKAYLAQQYEPLIGKANAEINDAWAAIYALSGTGYIPSHIPKVSYRVVDGSPVYSLVLDTSILPPAVNGAREVGGKIRDAGLKDIEVTTNKFLYTISSRNLEKLLNVLDEYILTPVHPDIAIKAKDTVIGPHLQQQHARASATAGEKVVG